MTHQPLVVKERWGKLLFLDVENKYTSTTMIFAGYVAFEREGRGAYFLLTLAQVLTETYRTTDFLGMMTEVRPM